MEFQVNTLTVSATQQTMVHKEPRFAILVWEETELSVPFLVIT